MRNCTGIAPLETKSPKPEPYLPALKRASPAKPIIQAKPSTCVTVSKLRKKYAPFYKDSADLPVKKTIKASGSTVRLDTAARMLKRRRKWSILFTFSMFTPLLQNGSIHPRKIAKNSRLTVLRLGESSARIKAWICWRLNKTVIYHQSLWNVPGSDIWPGTALSTPVS